MPLITSVAHRRVYVHLISHKGGGGGGGGGGSGVSSATVHNKPI